MVLTSHSVDRDFRNGRLEIDFPTEPFSSSAGLLRRSFLVFLRAFGFLALVTLVVFLPGKLILQAACYLGHVPLEGILSYFLLEVSDLVLGALAVPAIVYGLFEYWRAGRTPPLADCFRWARRQWLRTLGNKVKVEVTVTLWGALLVIPGIVAMVRLIFADIVVAIEGDAQRDVLNRSRELSLGRRWRIFFVLLPMMALDMAATFLVLDRIQATTHSRVLFAAAETVLAIASQWSTVAIVLMYLGLVEPAPSISKSKRLPR